MPVFDFFDGILIGVFPRGHLLPHGYAQYAEYEALIDIRPLTVLAGRLPAKTLKKVIAHMGAGQNQQDWLKTFYFLNPQIKVPESMTTDSTHRLPRISRILGVEPFINYHFMDNGRNTSE